MNSVGIFREHPLFLRILDALHSIKMQICVKVKIMCTEKGSGISFSSPISVNFQFGFAVFSVAEIRGILAAVLFPTRHLSVCYKMTKRWCKFGENIQSFHILSKNFVKITYVSIFKSFFFLYE